MKGRLNLNKSKKVLSLFTAAALFAGSLGLIPMTGIAAEQPTFMGTSPDNGDGTFRNPMLLTDVADPDCTVGYDENGNKAYYMVSTAMHNAPGAPIMRSYDLINWENAAYVYDVLDYGSDALSLRNTCHAYGKGQWAASIKYHNGFYYVLFSSYTTGKTYIYTTNSIESGRWKKSVIDALYHDPALYIDSDGIMYALYGGSHMRCTRLLTDAEGFVTVDESFSETTVIEHMGRFFSQYNSDYSPEKDAADYFIIEGEGPHVYNVDGKIYIIFISWPKSPVNRRIMVCYQADSLEDGIKSGFTGKIIYNDTVGYAEGEGVAQGGMMNITGGQTTSEGDWKAVIYQDRGPIGRCPFLLNVSWETDENGLKWPMLSTSQTMDKPIKGFPSTSIVVSDDFTNGEKRTVYPAITKESSAVLADAENASIVFNSACDGTTGQAPWYWGVEDGKTGTAVTVEDESNPSNKYMRMTGRGSADSGFFQWCNKSSGNEQNPVTLPQNGAEYNISFRARYSSESANAPESEIFMIKFNDSVLAVGEVKPDEWTTVSGTYTFGENEVGDWNSYRVLTENSTVDFDIDDVSIVPVGGTEPTDPPITEKGTEIINNTGMESVDTASNKPHYWNEYPENSSVSITSDTDAHDGLRSLAVTGRTSPADGIRQYIALTYSFEYTISAWIKSSSADNFKAVLMTNYWKPSTIMEGEVKKGEWTKLTGRFRAPIDWTGGFFNIESTNGNADFLIDDVSIREVPGQVLETPKEGENDYNGSNLNLAWQWNHNPDNTCWSLTDRDGWLRITTGKTVDNIQYARNILTQRSYGPTSAGMIKIDVSEMKNGDFAGLTTMQTRYGNIGIKMLDSRKYFVLQRIKEDAYKGEITKENWLTLEPEEEILGELTGDEAYVRLEYFYGNFDNKKEDGTAYFHYSSDGENWHYAGKLDRLNYDLKQFTGYKFGLFNYASEETGGYVDFDYFTAEDNIWGENGKPDAPAEKKFIVAEPVRDGKNAVIEVINTTDGDRTVNAYATGFDKDGRLTGVSAKSVVSSANSGSQKITLPADEKDKIFIWNENMEPYGEF